MKNDVFIKEAEKMASLYQRLFIIEKLIKENINDYEKKSELYFHECIPLVNKTLFSEDLRKKLYELVKVRNKICHMKSLDLNGESLLNDCYHEIIKKVNSK